MQIQSVTTARELEAERGVQITTLPSDDDGVRSFTSATSRTTHTGPTRGVTPASEGQGFPVFTLDPLVGMCYNVMTQLSGGRLSYICDPGAAFSLAGSTLARAMALCAKRNGRQVRQELLPNTVNISGVGNGSNQCTHKMILPAAVPQVDSTETVEMDLHTAIVNPPGDETPGLLGLDILEGRRAIMDVGQRRLIFPGPGPVEYNLPPGSITVPLEKAPSGHLCMVVNAYQEKPAAKTGGVAMPKQELKPSGFAAPEAGCVASSSEQPSSMLASNL